MGMVRPRCPSAEHLFLTHRKRVQISYLFIVPIIPHRVSSKVKRLRGTTEKQTKD